MLYPDIRPQIQTGDLLAWSHYEWRTIYDWQVQAVRIGTQSEYCHVGLAYVLSGRVMVLESVTPYVRLIPLSNLLKDGAYWMPLETPMSDAEEAFAMSLIGRGQYSKLDAIAGQIDSLVIGANDQWQCAEYVIACRRLSGLDLGPKATPAAVVRAGYARPLGRMHAIDPQQPA